MRQATPSTTLPISSARRLGCWIAAVHLAPCVRWTVWAEDGWSRSNYPVFVLIALPLLPLAPLHNTSVETRADLARLLSEEKEKDQSTCKEEG